MSPSSSHAEVLTREAGRREARLSELPGPSTLSAARTRQDLSRNPVDPRGCR